MENQKIDLASLDTASKGDAGAEFELEHPATREPLGVFITMAGADSRKWRNVVLDGEDLPCTLENARLVYRRFDWMREQAEAFCVDRGNFLPA